MVSFGRCNHYEVGANDCVIGPVFTSGSYRGKGLATFSLAQCINHLRVSRNCGYVYIDTKENNFSMQKVIEKVGFGPPCGMYERKNDKN